MPRTGAGRQPDTGGGLLGEHALRRMNGVREHLIHAEIADQREVIVGREIHRMGVGLLLARGIHARSMMLDERRVRPERAIGMDGERHHAAAAIVHRHQRLARGVHVQVARSGADRALLSKLRQFAGGLVDPVRRDIAAGLAPPGVGLVGGVEMLPVGVDGQEGGIRGRRNQSDRRGLARRGVEAPRMNPRTVRPGVGAHVGEVGFGSSGRCTHGKGGNGYGETRHLNSGTGLHTLQQTLRPAAVEEKSNSRNDIPIEACCHLRDSMNSVALRGGARTDPQ